MLIENLRVALVGLSSNKLRSALTMLGITIGVAAVIVLVSIGQAVDTFLRDQFQGLGTNLLVIFPGEDERGNAVPLTVRDAEALDDLARVPDASAVMPQLNLSRPVIYEGREALGRIRGVTADFPTLRNREVAAGRFFEDADVESSARVAVIGLTVVDRLFPDTFPLNQSIRIGGVTFRVIGVMAEAGGAGFGGDENDLIFVPVTTAQERLSGQRDLSGFYPLTQIVVQARTSETIDAVTQQIRATLREERDINFRDDDTFEVFTQTDLLDSLGQITGLLTIFLAVIAGISLLVGGIGIMNIMLVTVTERTREIGLRKAVGAQPRDIQIQFLMEAMMLSLVGGAVGVAIAAAGALLVSATDLGLSVNIQVSSVLVATLISISVGVFFGLYPASRAAKLNPIDALRYE